MDNRFFRFGALGVGFIVNDLFTCIMDIVSTLEEDRIVKSKAVRVSSIANLLDRRAEIDVCACPSST